MDINKKKDIVELFNNVEISFNLFNDALLHNKIKFKAEDNDIFGLINLENINSESEGKLLLLFEHYPEADYMYYFNENECLLTKLIRNKNINDTFNTLVRCMPSPEKMLLVNKQGENIIHIIIKNMTDTNNINNKENSDEYFANIDLIVNFYDKLNENGKKEILFQKDNTGKDIFDYLIILFKSYAEDDPQNIRSTCAFNMISDFYSQSKEFFLQKDINYKEEVWPLFNGHIKKYGFDDECKKLENEFLNITVEQEKRKIWQSLNTQIMIKDEKKRL